MKALIILLALMLPAAPASAAGVPLRVNFQGKLLDTSNLPRSGSISMEFRIFDAPSGGNLLWGPETQTPTVANGVFAVLLGASPALTPDIFTGGSAYLGVTVSPDVYPAGEMSPRQQLVASPYAVTAAQLAQSSDIRINAGVAYATFTTAGNLLAPYGIAAATASFSGALTASSGTFAAIGDAQYSLETSSGINVKAGTLRVAEQIVASNFIGNGSSLTNVPVTDGSIDTNKLATDSVANAKILTSAVDTRAIAADAVTNVKIAAAAVDTNKLAADAVTAEKIITAAVDTNKLAADSITTAKILTAAVTRGKIGDTKYAVKTADQAVTNSTVLASAADLTFPVLSGEVWAFEFVLMVSNANSATPDWKCAVLAPAGSTGKALLSGAEPAGASFPQVQTTDLTTPGTLVDGTIVADANVDFNVYIQGFVVAGGNGNVTLQFAENTAGAGTSITVRRGSFLRAYRQ